MDLFPIFLIGLMLFIAGVSIGSKGDKTDSNDPLKGRHLRVTGYKDGVMVDQWHTDTACIGYRKNNPPYDRVVIEDVKP